MARLRLLRVMGVLSALLLCDAFAEPLPSMSKHPWFGCYAGFAERVYDVAVTNRGDVEIFLKERGERSGSPRLKMKLALFEEQGSGRVIRRSFKKSGFVAKSEPAVNVEEVSYEAEATYGIRVAVSYGFDKEKGFKFSGSIIDAGKSKGNLSLAFELKTGDYYSLQNEDPKQRWKESTRGDSLTLRRKNGEKLRVKLMESPKEEVLPFLEAGGVESVVFDTKGLRGEKLECGLRSPVEIVEGEGIMQSLELDFHDKDHLTDSFVIRFRSGKLAKCLGYLKLR